MSQPYTYEDSIRTHDVAMWRWLRSLLVDYGTWPNESPLQPPPGEQPLLVGLGLGGPQQGFAAVVDLLVAMDWIKPTDTSGTVDEVAAKMKSAVASRFDLEVLPLPIAIIERREPVPDQGVRGVPKRLRKVHYNVETEQWEIHPWPAPYRTTYDITFWCLKRYTDNYFREWVLGQLGTLGMQDQEMLLSVDHRDPFGEWKQQLRWLSFAEQSDLEGPDQRYIRTIMTVELRTWIMRNPTVSAHPVTSIEAPIFGVSDTTSPASRFSEDKAHTTPNLYHIPWEPAEFAGKWPKTGDAEVAWNELAYHKPKPAAGLDLVLGDDDDSVTIADAPVTEDNLGVGIFSTAFRYLAPDPDPLSFEGLQRNEAGDITSTYELLLPPTGSGPPKNVHIFTVVADQMYQPGFAGTPGGAPRLLTVMGPDVRQVLSLDKIGQTTTVDLGSSVRYEWHGLAPHPYLVVGLLQPGIVGDAMVTVEDDVSAPTYTKQEQIDSAVNVGFALLARPKEDSLALVVPDALLLSAVYAAKYTGPYNGHTV